MPGGAHGFLGVVPGVAGFPSGGIPAAFQVAFHLVPLPSPVPVGGVGAVLVGRTVFLVGAGGVRVVTGGVGLAPVAVVLVGEPGGVADSGDGGNVGLQVRRVQGAAHAGGDSGAGHAGELVDAIEHAEPGGGAATRGLRRGRLVG